MRPTAARVALLMGPSLFALACTRASTDTAEKKVEKAEQAATAPGEKDTKAPGKLIIGFSMDTLKEERWQRDRDQLKAHIEKLGGTLLVQVANGDDALQNSQAENLLTQGAKVLVVAPHNAKTSATIVEAAHKMKVPVVAYDRMIMDSDLDYYVSFDNFRVGQLQAEYLVKQRPTGNYVLIEGAPTDNNARLYYDGQMQVLKPLVDSGKIKIVAEQWANNWQPVEALRIMENALTRNNNKVDAVVASNDGIAGAAIQSLGEQKLAGKVVVSGQDAELSACQRIATGRQSMTIYKPIKALASQAADLVIKLAKGEPVPQATRTVSNGKKEVPSLLIEPTVVDKSNLGTTVIADGFHKRDEVYKDLPKDQWPAL